MAAVRPGQDQIGAQALVLAAKQQFRVGHLDVIGMSRIEVDYRRVGAVAAAFRGRVSHCTLPATPAHERERPTHPLAGLRAATLFVGPPVAGEPAYIALIQRLEQVKLGSQNCNNPIKTRSLGPARHSRMGGREELGTRDQPAIAVPHIPRAIRVRIPSKTRTGP